MMSKVTGVKELLGLRQAPVAIGFSADPPAGVAKWEGGAVPAGCAFWQKAGEGQSFYTEPADHYNCAVGSYTHKLQLPPERGSELEQTIGFMVENLYLTMDEVPGIPTLAETPQFIAYGPADQPGFAPAVVIVAARPAQAMLIYEAALKAGAGNVLTNVLGRPGCAVVPLTVSTGTAALSFGCKGNRTFTGLPDDELYICITGDKWEAVTDKLHEAAAANAAMEQHYLAHQRQFTAP